MILHSCDRKAIAALCRLWGKLLKVPVGVDGVKLFWALSGNEGRFGDWFPPRHEPAFCHGGKYFNPRLHSEFGCWAHCSYGPLQIMFPNAVGWTPEELCDPEKNFEAVTAFLNREIFEKQKPKNLTQIGDAFNSGNFRDKLVPTVYIQRLKDNYAVEMPQ